MYHVHPDRVIYLFWLSLLFTVFGVLCGVKAMRTKNSSYAFGSFILLVVGISVPATYGFDMDYATKYRVTGEVGSVETTSITLQESGSVVYQLDTKPPTAVGKNIDLICVPASEDRTKHLYNCILP